MQEGEPHLAATARPTVAMVSATTAAALGRDRHRHRPRPARSPLPVVVGDVLDDVVWLPLNSPGCHVHADLGAVPGTAVRLSPGGAA